ncbi:hypothetical protein [Streptomyces fradiae]|uniref:hypothetical protein n=1 Tax=Streptomyces fradiae TaxID=1906 RepID=UPI0033EBE5DB
MSQSQSRTHQAGQTDQVAVRQQLAALSRVVSILVIVAVAAVVLGLAYLTWRHPGATGPVTVGIGALAVVVALAAVLRRAP